MSNAQDRWDAAERDYKAERDDTPAFFTWWRAVNAELEDRGFEEMGFRDARYWFERGYSPDTAARLQLENEDAAQEERSYYDV